MNPRVLKAEIEKIKATDAGQETDITALETAIGEVPTGEGNDLQSQVTALSGKIGNVPSGDDNDLQSQITALASRVKALEDEDTTGDT